MPRYMMVITELVGEGCVPPGNYISATRMLIPNNRPANEVCRAAFTHAGLTRDSFGVETLLVDIATSLANNASAM